MVACLRAALRLVVNVAIGANIYAINRVFGAILIRRLAISGLTK